MDELIKNIVNKHWKEIKGKKNVTGYSGKLQPKIKDGKVYPDKLVFRIYVQRKRKEEELSTKDLVPKTLGSIETDIVDIGEIKALDNKERLRPVKAGISTMHKDGTACTINAFFRDKETGDLLVASNNHCYGMENKAIIGDPILQPGPHDGGKYPEDVIGSLRKFVEINFVEFSCPYRQAFMKVYRKLLGTVKKLDITNVVDIAFASLSVPYEVLITYIGEFKGKNYDITEGDIVQKSGRTTEHTTDGLIIDTDWNGSVTYSRGIAWFTDCYLIQKDNFCGGGDSGSPVLDMNNNYIGALFAGSDTSTIVCKLKNIEEEANVELILSEGNEDE